MTHFFRFYAMLNIYESNKIVSRQIESNVIELVQITSNSIFQAF